jgi:hypothetical protein
MLPALVHLDTVLGLEWPSYERMIRQDARSVVAGRKDPSPRFAESAAKWRKNSPSKKIRIEPLNHCKSGSLILPGRGNRSPSPWGRGPG